MARRERYHSKNKVAGVNTAFVLGTLCLLGGLTALVFALGWYRLGPQMEDGSLWTRTVCTVSDSRIDESASGYSSKQRWRAEFNVGFPHEGKHFLGAAALVTLDNSWRSLAGAQQDKSLYPVGNTSECFCPLVDTNLYNHPERWSIYRFCLFQFTQSDLDHLAFLYEFWLLSGIVTCSLMVPLVLGIIYFWFGTRCYRRPFRWCPRGPVGGATSAAKYDILN